MAFTIRQLFKLLISSGRDWSDNEANAAIEKAIRFYYGQQLTDQYGKYYAGPLPKEPGHAWESRKRDLITVNITRMIVDKIAGGLYSPDPPLRSLRLTGDDGNVVSEEKTDDDGFPIIEYASIDEFQTMRDIWNDEQDAEDQKMLNRLKVLIGEMFVHVQMLRPENKINFQYVTPDQVQIFQNPRNPREFERIEFEQSLAETPGQNDVFKWIWTIDHWEEWKNKKLNDESENPFPFMPWIHVRFMEPAGSGDIHGLGLMHELIPLNQAGNEILSRVNRAIHTQTSGQPVFWNVPLTKIKKIFGDLTPLNLKRENQNEPADFKYVVPGGNVEAQIRWAETYFGMIFNHFGLFNENPVRLDVKNPESGIAKWIEESEVRNRQFEQRSAMLRYERRRAYMAMYIDSWYRNNMSSVSPEIESKRVKIMVQFPQHKPPVSTQDKIADENQDDATGIRNAVDIALERVQGLKSREDAIRHIVDRRVEKRRLKYLEDRQFVKWKTETFPDETSAPDTRSNPKILTPGE